MLDEAVQEVVRSMSKLRSMESKAEAASNLAEAEVALRGLNSQAGGSPEVPEAGKARDLLAMSAREFEAENYGGALYLSNQAKAQIKAGQLKLRRAEAMSPVEGEEPFALTLPLQVVTASNLRDGPGRGHSILRTLAKGTPLTGYSRLGQWVRVKTEDGMAGWIFHTLVEGR